MTNLIHPILREAVLLVADIRYPSARHLCLLSVQGHGMQSSDEYPGFLAGLSASFDLTMQRDPDLTARSSETLQESSASSSELPELDRKSRWKTSRNLLTLIKQRRRSYVAVALSQDGELPGYSELWNEENPPTHPVVVLPHPVLCS